MIKEKVFEEDKAAIDSFLEIVCEGKKIRAVAKTAAMVGLLSPFFDQRPSVWVKDKLQPIFTESFSDPRISTSEWPEITDYSEGDPGSSGNLVFQW